MPVAAGLGRKGKFMELIVISLTALLASGLTLFSGFGLGTLLMPVVALFMPLPVAIAVTALVHLANNLFKVALLGRYAHLGVILRFGLPAIPAALLGALVLGWLSHAAPWYTYTAFGHEFSLLPIKLLVGTLILGFVLLELSPRFNALAVAPRYLPLGGLISGFFGGLSGHQGAFRSLFLVKVGLDKEAFVATGTLLAVLIDLSRLLVYGWDLSDQWAQLDHALVMAASLSAFVGAWLGSRLLKKVTLQKVQQVVLIFLVVIALGLMAGFL